jgi:hypothetical protein
MRNIGSWYYSKSEELKRNETDKKICQFIDMANKNCELISSLTMTYFILKKTTINLIQPINVGYHFQSIR